MPSFAYAFFISNPTIPGNKIGIQVKIIVSGFSVPQTARRVIKHYATLKRETSLSRVSMPLRFLTLMSFTCVTAALI